MYASVQHSKSKKSKSIEELRRERKKREETERIRTAALLNGTLPDDKPGHHSDTSSSSLAPRWATCVAYSHHGNNCGHSNSCHGNKCGHGNSCRCDHGNICVVFYLGTTVSLILT